MCPCKKKQQQQQQRYQHEGRQAGGRGRAEGPKCAGERGSGRGHSHWGSSLPQPAPLYETPGHLLDKFIKDFLQPNKNFLDQLHKAVDTICTFLKENCFRRSTIKVQKIVQVSAGLSLKGGIRGRGLSGFWSSAMLIPTRGWRAKDEGGKLGRSANRTPVFGGGADALGLSVLNHTLWVLEASESCQHPGRASACSCITQISASVLLTPSPLCVSSPFLFSLKDTCHWI